MPPDTVIIMYPVDREELARRGRLGAATTNAQHNGHELTAPARAAFNRRFDDADARLAYFSALGRKSGEARRARKNAEMHGRAQ